MKAKNARKELDRKIKETADSQILIDDSGAVRVSAEYRKQFKHQLADAICNEKSTFKAWIGSANSEAISKLFDVDLNTAKQINEKKSHLSALRAGAERFANELRDDGYLVEVSDSVIFGNVIEVQVTIPKFNKD